MIGKLKGIIDSIGEDYIIIDVQGVGYQVYCSTRTMAGLSAKGEAIVMVIETHVRETEIKLFGFSSELERSWFCLLQSVQGIGVKAALAIQSTLSISDLSSAIALQDKTIMTRAPGVGPKVAQRIISELKDKAPSYSSASAEEMGLITNIGDDSPSAVKDAISALGNLGYSSQQATIAVASAVKSAGNEAGSAELIRLGLKELSG